MWQALQSVGRTLTRGVLQLLYPVGCLHCGRMLPPADHGAVLASSPFCAYCHQSLTTDDSQRCPLCALPIGPHTFLDPGCSRCTGSGLRFDRAICLGAYYGSLQEMVLKLKHHSGEQLAELIGRCWGQIQKQELECLQVDMITPIPLHWWRQRQRGYNQSRAIATGLSEVLGVPVVQCLRRNRYTPPQTHRSRTERLTNVKDAFQLRRWGKVEGKRILLVDDVITTASTVNEASKVLKQAGASMIVAGGLARAGGESGAPLVAP